MGHPWTTPGTRIRIMLLLVVAALSFIGGAILLGGGILTFDGTINVVWAVAGTVLLAVTAVTAVLLGRIARRGELRR